jgi:hypothetical protein
MGVIEKNRKSSRTYPNNSRVIGHHRRLVLLDGRVLLNAEVLHVAASEHNVLVDLVGGTNLLFRPSSSALSAVGTHIFERHSRLIGIDLVEGASVPRCRVSTS